MGPEKPPVLPPFRLRPLLGMCGCSEMATQVGTGAGEGVAWGPAGGHMTHACIVVVAAWKLKRFSLGNHVRMGVSSGRDEEQ